MINAPDFLFVLGKYPARNDAATMDRPSREMGEIFLYRRSAQRLLKRNRPHVEIFGKLYCSHQRCETVLAVGQVGTDVSEEHTACPHLDRGKYDILPLCIPQVLHRQGCHI
jgi:hypothetical protein